MKQYKPSLSLRDISLRGRDKFGLCVRQKPAAHNKKEHIA